MTTELSGLLALSDVAVKHVHRALSVSEILYEIFSVLGPSRRQGTPDWFFESLQFYDNSTCRPTLASLAVTCRAFSSPALDMLWKVMNSIRPLFAILPGFEREVTPSNLNGVVEPVHWERFRQYANRIRRISPNTSPGIDELAYLRIMQLLKGEPLLPRLQSIECLQSHSALLFLVPPNLRCISLQISGSGVGKNNRLLDSLVHGLADAAPLLHDFEFITESNTVSSSFLTALARFENLHRLALDSPSSDVGFIFSLQTISDLYLDLRSSPLRMSTSSATAGLPNLKYLVVIANPVLVGDILDFVTSDILSRLEIVHSTPAERLESFEAVSSAWEGCLSKICRWSQSLLNLALTDDQLNYGPPKTDGEATLNLLDKLLQLPKLTFLYMDFIFGLTIPDGDVKKMAFSWPNLHALRCLTIDQASFSLLDLETIAMYWPNLRELDVPIDLLKLSPPRRVTVQAAHQLQYLYVDSMSGEDPDLMAQHLDSLFPFVSLVGSPPEHSLVQLEDALKACRKAREES